MIDKHDFNGLENCLKSANFSCDEQDKLIFHAYENVQNYKGPKKLRSIFHLKELDKINKATVGSAFDILALFSGALGAFCFYKSLKITGSVAQFSNLSFRKQAKCLGYFWGGLLSSALSIESIKKYLSITWIRQAQLILEILCQNFGVTSLSIENKKIVKIFRS